MKVNYLFPAFRFWAFYKRLISRVLMSLSILFSIGSLSAQNTAAPIAIDDVSSVLEDLVDTINVIVNDTDANGPVDSTSVTIITQGLNGTAVPLLDGTVEYTPNPDFVGVDQFEYSVCDIAVLAPACDYDAAINGIASPVWDSIVINSFVIDGAGIPVNITWDIAADPFGVVVSSELNIALAANLNDQGSGVNLFITPLPFGFVWTFDFDINQSTNVFNSINYTVYDPSLNGPFNVPLVVSNCGFALDVIECDIATVTITVNGTPDTTLVSTSEEVTLTLCADTETNFAGPIDNIQLCGGPLNGNASSTFLPCVDYTPNTDYVGPDTLCVISCSAGVCDTTIFAIDVMPVNDSPLAVDDVLTTTEDVVDTINVIANDSDIEGPLDSTSLTIITQGANGTALALVDGTIEYTPNSNFVGVDVFTYAVCDTNATFLCDTATVTVTINGASDTTLVSTLEDVMLTLCTDTETNFAGPIDNIQICSAPINGVASPSFLPCVDYTPNADYVGQDTMCVVSCSAGVCDTTIFVIDVTPVNDAPVALDDADVTTEDTPVTTDVIVNDSDVEGPLDSVSVAIVSQGTYGMAVSNGDGTVTYTPNTDFVGVDMYTYVVCDTNTVFLCDTATVTLTINGTPDTTMVATAEDVMLTVCTNTETNFAGPIDNIQICSAPINGVATPSFLPCVDYTPNADYVGLDTMCVISCSAGVCDTTIFVIDVTPVNDAPIAFDDVDVTTEDIPVTTDVIVNDSDVEGPLDSASIVILTQGTNGTAVSNGDGTATYTPNTDYVGVDVFTYEVCDTNAVALCNTATVTITINSAPDSSAISVIEDLGPVAICTDSLTNFGAATIDNQFICGNPSNGTLNTTFLPCIDYNPNPDFYGQDSFCIVTCAGAFCDTTYVAVTVVPVIDVPVLDAFANICETDPIPALTGTSEPGSIINWFDENDVLVGTGSPFTPPATLGVNCYSAIAVHAGLGLSSPDTAEVCFTIDSLPLNVSAGPDDTICGFQDYELQGTGTGNLTFWTQLVGQVVALDAADSNAIVSLEANNLPGTDNVYTFAWTNENGLCVVSDTVTIVVTEPHLTSAGNDTTICLTEAGGSVQLNATLTPGATGYWIYVGSESLTWSDSTDNQAIVDGLVPYNNPTSTYLFEWYEIIADCIAKDEVIITVNEAAGLDVLAADTFCLFTDYTLDATITGFSQASYSWRTDSITGPILSWDEDAIVSPLVNTTYYVVANVSFGQNFCSTIDSLELWVDGFPVSNDDGCYPLFEDSLLVGSTNDWLFNDDLTAVITGNVGFEVLDGGSRLDPASTIVIDNATDSYVYTPFSNMSGVDSAVIIAFNEACPHLRDTFTVCFNVIPVTDDPIVAMPDTVDVIAGTTVSISVLDNDTLDNEAVDTIITILLDPLFGSIDTPIINGQVVYNSETMYAEVDSFQYIVCQYLVDGEELCDTTTVILLVDGELYIPEGFTPNGDGVNDNFEIPNIELVYPNATMNIFNRWGDEVWNSKTPYRNNWTGLNFGDSQLPNGTYFYIVNLNNGSKRKIASYVVIYR